MSDGPLPYKRDVANMLLRKGSLFIHLDPRVSDVMVPPWLRHQAQLVLQVGFDMPIPIPDLRIDEDGVFGTLSFSRTPFACTVPWNAVFALVGDEGRGMVWPESMPAEIAAEVEREANRAKLGSVPTDADKRAPRTRASEGDVLRWPGSGDSDKRESKSPKEPVVAVLRAAEPDGRPRRDSSRPGAPRTSGRRGTSRSLPPYLRVVK
jgi:stringent starvation protein B